MVQWISLYIYGKKSLVSCFILTTHYVLPPPPHPHDPLRGLQLFDAVSATRSQEEPHSMLRSATILASGFLCATHVDVCVLRNCLPWLKGEFTQNWDDTHSLLTSCTWKTLRAAGTFFFLNPHTGVKSYRGKSSTLYLIVPFLRSWMVNGC